MNFVMPIEHGRYTRVWEMYQQAKHAFWDVEEVDMTEDRKQWLNKLSDNERHFISHVLAFFAGADGIVVDNLVENFMQHTEVREVQCFYQFQTMMENIHAEMYSIMIDTLIREADEKQRLFNAIQEIPCVKKKADWALKWMKSKEPVEALVAFAAVEGIFFSGSFCAIYWLKKRNLMPGLTQSNELISRDEAMHVEFAVLLYQLEVMGAQLAQQTIYDIISEAVDIEREFVCESLSVGLIGMNADLMSQYIEFVADHLLASLGCDKLYHTQNPFPWMELISLQGKTNFFEKRVTEYQRAGERVFSVNEDF
jgi:ribonucleoside-diphosphate reductase beta chain